MEVLTAPGWKKHTHEQFIELELHIYDDSLDADWIYANPYLTYADSVLIDSSTGRWPSP